MKYIFLIALREYAENAKTKGFWIGIFMLPLIMAISLVVSTKLSKVEPSRYFVIVDKSGAFQEPVMNSLEWNHQSAVLRALGEYVGKNLKPGQKANIDLESNPPNVSVFWAAGGKDVYLERLKPVLRDDAPAFQEPNRSYLRVDLPKDIDASASNEAILAQLKPYLLGEKMLAVDGENPRLFAALVIEPNALDTLMAGSSGETAIQYWSTNLAVDNLPNQIRGGLDYDLKRRLYVSSGVEFATVRQIEDRRVRIGAFDPGKTEGAETVSTADRIAGNIPVAFVYLLWISIFTVMLRCPILVPS